MRCQVAGWVDPMIRCNVKAKKKKKTHGDWKAHKEYITQESSILQLVGAFSVF